MNIGKSIKFIRVAAEIKQGEMAQKLGVSQNYLSLLENNKSEPSLSLLKKISRIFNIPIGFLLVEENVAFESEDAELGDIYKQLQKLILELQRARIKKRDDDVAKPCPDIED